MGETENAEKAAALSYASFMKTSTEVQEKKHAAEVRLRLDKDQVEYELGETKKDLSATEEELARADKYFEFLRPNCVEIHVNWDERVARRQEEVAALKETKKDLSARAHWFTWPRHHCVPHGDSED